MPRAPPLRKQALRRRRPRALVVLPTSARALNRDATVRANVFGKLPAHLLEDPTAPDLTRS